MISTIISHVIALVIGAIAAVFIYRNNVNLLSGKAEQIDKIWDKLGLTDKIKSLEDKIDELLKKK